MKNRKWLFALCGAVILSAGCGREQGGAEAANGQEVSEASALQDEKEQEHAAKSEEQKENPEIKEASGKEDDPDDSFTETVTLKPLDVWVMPQYMNEWSDPDANGDTKLIYEAQSPRVLIGNDGYAKVKAALESFSEEQYQNMKNEYDNSLPYAKEMYAEDPEFFSSFSDNHYAYCVRADDRVVSIKESGSNYQGGIHGMYWEGGTTFDTESGEKLLLSDVITDSQALTEYSKNYLKDNYDRLLFFDNYEETVEGYFADRTVEPDWYLDGFGLNIVFNSYMLAPYSEGDQTVVVPYGKDPGLIKPEFWYSPTGAVFRLDYWSSLSLDIDGDGIQESIFVDNQADTENGYTEFIVYCGENSLKKQIWCYDIKNIYVLQPEQNKTYLYAEFLLDNDARLLEVFDLSTGRPRYVGESYDSFGEGQIIDTGSFVMETRIDALGTYTGYRHYSIGTDGMPKSDETVYNIFNFDPEYTLSLTSVRTIPVWMEEGGEKKKTELPAGTEFVFRKTDGESFVEMELKDGKRCEIRFERKDWECVIDGVSENDCFEYVPYAG